MNDPVPADDPGVQNPPPQPSSKAELAQQVAQLFETLRHWAKRDAPSASPAWTKSDGGWTLALSANSVLLTGSPELGFPGLKELLSAQRSGHAAGSYDISAPDAAGMVTLQVSPAAMTPLMMQSQKWVAKVRNEAPSASRG